MAEKDIQIQIDELNSKVDVILDYVNQQRLKSGAVEDLISDVSIIGKDAYDSVVAELETQAVEIDLDELKILGIKFIKNIKNFNSALSMFESVNDLAKDAAPIANEMIIDFTKKMHEFEQKGYFEFFRESGKIMDNIVTHFTPEDVRLLADNIVTIMETVKSLTQPGLMNMLNKTVSVYEKIETDTIPEYSMWKLFREMQKPEMKRSMGFLVTLLKDMSKADETTA